MFNLLILYKMKPILILCLLLAISCSKFDFISTAKCLIKNKSVQEEAFNLFNKIIKKEYDNIFQNLIKAFTTIKDIFLNECMNNDDDIILQKITCTNGYQACRDVCWKKKTRELWLSCLNACEKRYCYYKRTNTN